MTTKSRLLGLAFAAADTLLEIDGGGRVTLAIGAGPAPGSPPAEDWTGRQLVDLVGKASRKPIGDALLALKPNERSAPLDALIACDADHVRRARIRLFQLPDLAPAVSCAIAYDGAPFSLALPAAPPMLAGDALLSRVRSALRDGEGVAVAFIDVAGLGAGGEPHRRAAARIEAVLQSASVDGSSAARLAPEQFAVLRSANAGADLDAEVREAGLAEGLDLPARTTTASLTAGRPVEPTVRALRYALEACLGENGVEGARLTFDQSLAKTMKDADRFRTMVRNRDFALEYQPIVDLETDIIHHFEALARFGSAGPAAAIQQAEELGLIEGFDLAVAEKALRQMSLPGFGLTKVAINVSGASFSSDNYVEGLLRLTGATPDIRKRLQVEVTETAAVADLDAATRRLAALRRVGIQVCLDDFGVGSASLDYLHRLPVDTVKIDGRFVREVMTDSRSRALIAHLVELCATLKVRTVAEMIETTEQADAVRSMGVTYGQGWLFGRPAAQPLVRPPATPVTGRRLGEVAAWG